MEQYRGTTILSVRRNGKVVIGGDGQVSLGNTIMKGNARKVRRLYKNQVIAGFAGGTADAFTLFERFEAKLEQHQGNLTKAAVELAKDWRTDRILRKLEALLAVADAEASLIITGNGDVIQPEDDLIAIGSGGLTLFNHGFYVCRSQRRIVAGLPLSKVVLGGLIQQTQQPAAGQQAAGRVVSRGVVFGAAQLGC